MWLFLHISSALTGTVAAGWRTQTRRFNRAATGIVSASLLLACLTGIILVWQDPSYWFQSPRIQANLTVIGILVGLEIIHYRSPGWSTALPLTQISAVSWCWICGVAFVDPTQSPWLIIGLYLVVVSTLSYLLWRT